MAVGTGMGLDVSKLDKELDRLDKKLDALIKKGEKTEKAFETMFKGASAKNLLDHLDKVQSKISDISKLKDPMKWDSNSLVGYIDQVNRLLRTIEKANTAQGATPIKIINMEDLMAAKRELQTMLREVKALEKAQAQRTTSRNQTYAGAMRYSANANTLEKERQAIENLKVARDKLKQSDADYATKLNALNEAIKRHEKSLKDATKTDKDRADEADKNAKKIADAQAKYDSISRRERYKAYTTSYEGAIRTSDKAKTLAQEIQAVKNLEAARAKLNKTSADYDKKLANINKRIKTHNENIDKATRGAKKLREEHQSLGQMAGGLGRMLASAFSIQAIRGYINQMIQVRGEFELQQKALRAIIQDKDAADEVWQKTIDLAVRSPFRIKDLVTYTKQLAAYRVEADKLYDTNKMLADISSGLGVDMSRLILAFGQVKAANYLRGTELRQFSEAGINMLGELSKYFTELEGRAVSVGDVFERISKRMVSFADVEEVLKRITSEGGTFYRMQEIQAETLKGQISNLKDSIDIMLNDMGKTHEDTLKGMVSLTKNIVDNWRSISAIAIPLIAALITRWGIFRIVTTKNAAAVAGFAKTFGRHFGVVITQLTRGTRVAKQFAKSTQVSIMGGWTTVILAVVAALVMLVKTIQNVNRVKRELEQIELSGAFDASKSIAEYKRLADTVSDTSKTYEEQKKALDTLQRKYKDILPDHLLQAQSIRDLKGDYEDATNAIREYIAAKTKEKQIAKVEETYGDKVNTYYANFAKNLRDRISAITDANVALSDVTPIVDKMQEGFESGEITLENYNEKLKELIRTHSGLDVTIWKDYRDILRSSAGDFLRAVDNMNNAIEDISGKGLEWGGLKQRFDPIYEQFNAVRDEAEATKNSLNALFLVLRDFGKMDAQGNALVSQETYNETISTLDKMFDEVGIRGIEWSSIINDPFKLRKATTDYNVALWDKMIKQISDMPILPQQSGAKDNFIEMLSGERDAFKGTGFQQEINRILIGMSDEMSVALTGLESLFASSEQSVSDYAKTVQTTLERLKASVAEYDNDVEKGVGFSPIDPTQVDLMREQIPLVEEFLKLFDVYLKNSKDPKPEDTFTPMLRTVKEIYQEFKKLQGSFDDLTAKEGALAKFGDAFREAFGKTPEQMGFDLFSEEGVKAAYDYLISKAPDAKKKIQAQLAKGEIVWDVKLQTKKNADKELMDGIQELFDRYDLTLELKKLNIPPDLAKSLFNVDYLDLEGLKKAVMQQREYFVGKDMLDEYDDLIQKIGELSKKAQEEEAKEFVNFLKKNLDEIKLIQDKGAYNIALADRLFGEGTITAEQYMSSIRQIVQSTNEEVAKINLDKFKDSSLYIKAMGDLAAYTREELEAMAKALEDALANNAGDMGVDEIQAYHEALKRINKEQEKFEPFFSENNIAKLLKYKELEDEYNKVKEEHIKLLEEEARLKKEAEQTERDLDRLEGERLFAQEGGDNTLVSFIEEKIKATKTQAVETEKALESVNGQIADSSAEMSNISGQMGEIAGGASGALMMVDMIIKEVYNTINAAIKVFEDAKELAESFGKETDKGSWREASDAFNLIGNFNEEVMAGWENLKSGNVIGAVANTVGSILGFIRDINKAIDSDYAEEIANHAEKVEDLQKAYEKLEESIEEAYSIEQMQQYNAELERNVELQIASYKAMIAAENAKKNTDTEQIEAWNEELEDLTKQWEDLKDSLLEGVGGVAESSFRSQTREFVDAWVSAYQETGDGLKGLQDNFRDFFDNIIAEQAAMRVTEKFLEPFYKSLNTALGDFELTMKESKDLREEADKIMPELSKALELIWTQLGGSRGEAEAGGLSALQKGIHNLSESTGQVIESLLNSMRFYQVDSNAELKNQTKILGNIYNLLDGMRASMPSGSGYNGYGFKTVM